jgi:two-component system cell cycle response regulator
MFGAIALMAARAMFIGDTLGEGAPSRLVLLATVIGACAAVARATGRSRERVTERAAGLAEETAAARSLAMTDALTGLGNRRALDEHLARFAADAQRTGVPFSVVAIDIDGLKRVNDHAGHDAGDALLRDFARAIDQAIRGSDIGLRTGGDEFVILLPRTTEVAAKTVAERLAVASERFSTPFGPPRFSYGIATYGRGDAEYDVISRADAALNQQKRERGGRPA